MKMTNIIDIFLMILGLSTIIAILYIFATCPIEDDCYYNMCPYDLGCVVKSDSYCINPETGQSYNEERNLTYEEAYELDIIEYDKQRKWCK